MPVESGQDGLSRTRHEQVLGGVLRLDEEAVVVDGWSTIRMSAVSMRLHPVGEAKPRRRDAGSASPMAMVSGKLLGSDQVGVRVAVVGRVAFHPPDIGENAREKLEASLDLELVPMTIGGSGLLGSLIAGNQRGVAVADLATEDDIDALTAYGDVVVMESMVNAAGNLLLINDHGALVSPVLPEEGLDLLSEVLGGPVLAGRLAGHDTVGSVAACNNQGAVVHPDTSESEAEVLTAALGVTPMVSTVCFGSPFLGAGLIASDHGAYVGEGTTGPELNRIEDALGLIDTPAPRID